MIYTTTERNNAIMSVANGNADFNNVDLYERLESFNWVYIKRVNGVIDNIELTYAGKNLQRRLVKQHIS